MANTLVQLFIKIIKITVDTEFCRRITFD